MFEQVEGQQSHNRRSRGTEPLPIRVVVYGASLFLSAVSAVLQHDAAIELIYLPVAVNRNSILEQNPNVLLWHRHFPIENSAGLLSAGVWLLEIDEQQNSISIQHQSCTEVHTKPIQNSTDLIGWIIEPARLKNRNMLGKSA